MITTPTVFILGAGASHDYGFPLGYELYKIACAQLQSNKNGWKNLRSLGFLEEEISDFSLKLYLSELESIDTFVNYNTKYERIGKAITASILMAYENEGKLINKEIDSWYRYLWNKMRTDTLSQFAENHVAFITFNYDRSLEHYLFIVLKYTFSRENEEIIEVLNKIPIIHVYGQLGNLPWQDENGRTYSSPNQSQMTEEIRKCMSMIELVYGSREVSPKFREAIELLQWAERGYFLGFGYDDINLRNLNITGYDESVIGNSFKLSGTRIGLSDKEIEIINKKYRMRIEEMESRSIYNYLKEEVEL
ncbi:MAG: hypothetical protein COB85_06835 [Bacteroidetes bacterium]|nr:MAG: hypothetical protein COB85_06835 [Bacteroidota bacterium]